MPWKHNGIIIKEGKSWSDGTYKHPYNWASAWSDADKKKFKLTFGKFVSLFWILTILSINESLVLNIFFV